VATGLLLVGHGSRDPLTRQEHNDLEARMREHFPEWRVASGFIELSDPPLAVALTALAQRCDRVVVAPLLLFAGGHMQRDVPLALIEAQRAAPQTQFVISEPLGLSVHTLDLAVERLGRHEREGVASVCLVVGRGAAERVAQESFQQVVDTLASRRPHHHYAVAYCGVQAPSVFDALDAHARQGCSHAIVVPYLLFTGTLHQEIGRAVAGVRKQHPSIDVDLAGHLGPAAARAVAAQVSLAISGGFMPKS